MSVIGVAERRLLPDALLRFWLRRQFAKRLRAEARGGDHVVAERRQRFLAELDAGPIAVDAEPLGRRRPELPAEFFRLHLGARMKHSSCLYATGRESLAGAEQAMFSVYADRAELVDGQRILDLGCGWGSFTLWAAARYQRSHVTGLTNSQAQREHIEAEVAERGLRNVTIRTGNIVDFEFGPSDLRGGFDRIVSVEMFERIRNYRLLFAKVARWLAEDGRLFVHVFANRHVAYPFGDREADDWMARNFLIGETMPSFDLFKRFDEDLDVEKRWWISGNHYQRTADDWLRRMDAAEAPIRKVLEATYGRADARLWFARWRMFYMAVSELFGFDDGTQWGVAHYRFVKAGQKTFDA